MKESYDQPRQHIKKQRHYFATKGPSSQGYGFSSSHVWLWDLDCKETWMLKDWCFELWFWRSLLRVRWTERDPTSPSQRRSVLGVHWKDWCWSWNSNTLATWCEELTPLKRPWCWERLRAGGEGDGWWDGCMASPTQWTRVWVNSGSFWWTGMLQSMGVTKSQTQLSDWTELNWITLCHRVLSKSFLSFQGGLRLLVQRKRRKNHQ